MPENKQKSNSSSKRLRNRQSVKNIKRIDSPKAHGWQVHVSRGGVLKTKLFSDKIHGTKKEALETAKAYRDEVIKEMAAFSKPRKIQRTPRSNTGHLGVSMTEHENKSGKKHQVIAVNVRKELGKAIHRKFSVDKLGYDQAVKEAVAWRNAVLKERARKES